MKEITKFCELLPGDLLVIDSEHACRPTEMFVLAVELSPARPWHPSWPHKWSDVLWLSHPDHPISYHPAASFTEHGWRLIR